MEKLVKKFLSEEEKKRVIEAVKEVEKTTSGEIVPMIVGSSYHYPLADMIGALILGALTAVVATLVVSMRKSWAGFSIYDLWLFPAVFAVAFVVFHEIVKRIPWLKRFFISKEEMLEEVEEKALTSFYSHGLGNTRDRTGVLIFISVFERLAYVLADKGINEKVDSGVWQEVVDIIIKHIKSGKQAEGIVKAVKRCGELLRDNFPIKPDDTDELENLIM